MNPTSKESNYLRGGVGGEERGQGGAPNPNSTAANEEAWRSPISGRAIYPWVLSLAQTLRLNARG